MRKEDNYKCLYSRSMTLVIIVRNSGVLFVLLNCDCQGHVAHESILVPAWKVLIMWPIWKVI